MLAAWDFNLVILSLSPLLFFIISMPHLPFLLSTSFPLSKWNRPSFCKRCKSSLTDSFFIKCQENLTEGVGDGQGSLVCCDSWGHRESDTTERLNWTELMRYISGIWKTSHQSVGSYFSSCFDLLFALSCQTGHKFAFSFDTVLLFAQWLSEKCWREIPLDLSNNICSIFCPHLLSFLLCFTSVYFTVII